MSRGKLETKVYKYPPLKDAKGRYIPYCNFGYHRGISQAPKICEERNCVHFKKLYIPK